MVHDKYCSICDTNAEDEITKTKQITAEQSDDISFAALLALVPVMTMTLFSLMGFI